MFPSVIMMIAQDTMCFPRDTMIFGKIIRMRWKEMFWLQKEAVYFNGATKWV
jgi:hypothetical protein